MPGPTVDARNIIAPYQDRMSLPVKADLKTTLVAIRVAPGNLLLKGLDHMPYVVDNLSNKQGMSYLSKEDVLASGKSPESFAPIVAQRPAGGDPAEFNKIVAGQIRAGQALCTSTPVEIGVISAGGYNKFKIVGANGDTTWLTFTESGQMGVPSHVGIMVTQANGQPLYPLSDRFDMGYDVGVLGSKSERGQAMEGQIRQFMEMYFRLVMNKATTSPDIAWDQGQETKLQTSLANLQGSMNIRFLQLDRNYSQAMERAAGQISDLQLF
ncbi:hypothetical protein HY214_03045 [Candidatus Roizmanbacteria bacterium]|nr:hypothetical protein [Candidatus Roizmanbacteria bacterium]